MEYFLQKGKIIGRKDFNPVDEWLGSKVTTKITMWFAHGEIPFFENHVSNLNQFLSHLELPCRIDTSEQNELLRLCRRLINKNMAYMGGWIHLHFFLTEEKLQYVGTLQKYPEREIPFDEHAKLAVVADEIKWSKNKPEQFAFVNERRWNTNRLMISGSRHGEVIFCNENSAVVETAGANIYCIEKNKLFTPSLETGCYIDNLRGFTIKAAQLSGLEVVETEQLTVDHLLKMDEIFTVSESMGFRWIMGIGIKRYLSRFVGKIRDDVDLLLWRNRKKQQARR